LLVVIHKQTLRAKSSEEKIDLLKETAHVWELDLRNRWEAVDAWGKVLELAPNDNEASRAMGRLDRRSLPPGHARAQQRPGAPAPQSSPPAARSGASGAPSARSVAPAARAYVDDLTDESSVELETIEELDIEPEPVRAPRRSAPPPPPPQALQTGQPRPKTSAPPPPPPPKPRSNQ
jgi:hypothetical protein